MKRSASIIVFSGVDILSVFLVHEFENIEESLLDEMTLNVRDDDHFHEFGVLGRLILETLLDILHHGLFLDGEYFLAALLSELAPEVGGEVFLQLSVLVRMGVKAQQEGHFGDGGVEGHVSAADHSYLRESVLLLDFVALRVVVVLTHVHHQNLPAHALFYALFQLVFVHRQIPLIVPLDYDASQIGLENRLDLKLVHIGTQTQNAYLRVQYMMHF